MDQDNNKHHKIKVKRTPPRYESYDPREIPLLRPLLDDMELCSQQPKPRDDGQDQSTRRIYVRCIFAYVEAWLHYTREQIAENMAKTSNVSSREMIAGMCLIHNIKPVLHKKGTFTIDSLHAPLINRLAFVLGFISRSIHGQDLNYNDSGWADLQVAIKIRNRITHPTIAEDLVITDKELKSIGNAVTWLMSVVGPPKSPKPSSSH